MAEDKKIFTQKVEYEGIFDFKEFYNFIYDFLEKKGYDVCEKKNKSEHTKGFYTQSIDTDALKKINDYFKNKIGLGINAKYKKIYAEKGKKKVVMCEGKVSLLVECYFISDYQGSWEKHPAKKFLRGVYDKYVIDKNVEKFGKKLIKDADALIAEAKFYLGIGA